MTAGILAGLVIIIVMISLIVLGIPVAVATGMVAVGGMWLLPGEAYLLATLKTLPYAVTSSYAFVVVPMFLLMGALASASGMVGELYTAAHRWLGGIRGSLYMATTAASAGFAAVSGSTIVNASVFTRIALPEMLRFGYNKQLAAGCIAAAGTFAALIPPSISMVLYGILTGESIGALLMAGVIPGGLTAVAYLVFISLGVRFRPAWAPTKIAPSTWPEKWRSLGHVWPIALLATVVIGGIYGGWVPPSAAGTFGAIGALLIGLAKRGLSVKGIIDSLKETAVITAVIFMIIVSGMLLSRLLLTTGFVTDLTNLIRGSAVSPYAYLALIVILYLALGMIMDPISMMVMTLPFVFPVVKALGFDPIWFGVIMVKLIELGAITPPVGINLFAVVSASDGKVSVDDLYKGIGPFIVIELVVLAILVAFPALSTALPRAMVG